MLATQTRTLVAKIDLSVPRSFDKQTVHPIWFDHVCVGVCLWWGKWLDWSVAFLLSLSLWSQSFACLKMVSLQFFTTKTAISTKSAQFRLIIDLRNQFLKLNGRLSSALVCKCVCVCGIGLHFTPFINEHCLLNTQSFRWNEFVFREFHSHLETTESTFWQFFFLFFVFFARIKQF